MTILAMLVPTAGLEHCFHSCVIESGYAEDCDGAVQDDSLMPSKHCRGYKASLSVACSISLLLWFKDQDQPKQIERFCTEKAS